MHLAGKAIIITGGSSGIGLALAEALGAKGARLLLAARRPERLADAVAGLQARGFEAYAVPADVGSEAGRADLLAAARGRLGPIDVLINNAGAVRAGRLEHATEDEIRAMIDVDLVAPILLTRAVLPDLRRSGEGLVVNVAGGSAFFGMPFYAAYSATKAGLARFGEALRRELLGEGVQVMTAYPAATDTPMLATNRAGPELGFDKEPASATAAAIVAGMENGARDVICGGEARARMVALNHDDPGALDARFLAIKPALERAVRDHVAL